MNIKREPLFFKTLCSSFTYYLTKREKRWNDGILAIAESLDWGPRCPNPTASLLLRKIFLLLPGKTLSMLTHEVPEQNADTPE